MGVVFEKQGRLFVFQQERGILQHSETRLEGK